VGVNIAVGDLLITDDGARWRIHSIHREGAQRSVVAVHLARPIVLTADVSCLVWSEADDAWRFQDPGISRR
jgi:hypothetical protein